MVNIHSYARVGSAYMAINAHGDVIGIVKAIPSQLYQSEVERQIQAYRSVNREQRKPSARSGS
jgi:hypothetical protein